MKNNLPVTSTERFLQPGRPIVTKTDLQSVITYANESFLGISGFTREELIGQPHNMVRHPDMPPAAFADMWRVFSLETPGAVWSRTAARTVTSIGSMPMSRR